jgi:hypothetical protein
MHKRNFLFTLGGLLILPITGLSQGRKPSRVAIAKTCLTLSDQLVRWGMKEEAKSVLDIALKIIQTKGE